MPTHVQIHEYVQSAPDSLQSQNTMLVFSLPYIAITDVTTGQTLESLLINPDFTNGFANLRTWTDPLSN